MASKPVWISHRGISHNCDENTRDAFDLSIEGGFTHLETDLRITADGQIVLCHDRSLMRVAGDERNVDQLPRAALETIVLRRGGHLMFLDEFIERYAAYHWTFDIKPESGAAVVEALVLWANEKGAKPWIEAQARFLFWRSNHESMLRRSLPHIRCYATKRECWRAGLAIIAGVPALGGISSQRTYAVPPALAGRSLFRAHYVDRFHELGARVIAFLPQDERQTRAAIAAGFDEILTNDGMLP